MACPRSINTRLTLLTRRLHPSFGHLLANNNDDTESNSPISSPSQAPISKTPPQCSYNRVDGLASILQGRTCSSFPQTMGLGFSFYRHMSTTKEKWSEKLDDVGFVAEVIPEKTLDAVASQAPAINEVAIAAADSPYPVAALQYLIDAVHSFTGLNWWASIALTTLLIRGFTVPLLISQLKATSKLNMMRPHLEKLRQEMNDKAMDPDAVIEGQKKMKALFDEYGVTPFTPLKGLLIQGPIFISFFLAVRNMAEKVPSLKSGGALWFTDLTTPDSLFILPILTSLTFWVTVECNMQEGLEGNPVAGTMKYFSRILAVVAVPVMITFPKALFCYWLTSNLFSLTYGLVIRRPEVKKLLALPEIPVPPSDASQPKFSLFSALKQQTAIKAEPSVPSEPSNLSDRRISRSSIISQRLRSLEKQAKGRKKNKK